jgi:hypothetical protein
MRSSSPCSRRCTPRPSEHWGVYETCEELVDIEDLFQQWRFRHLQVVTAHHRAPSRAPVGRAGRLPAARRSTSPSSPSCTRCAPSWSELPLRPACWLPKAPTCRTRCRDTQPMPRVIHTAQALVDVVVEVPSLPRAGRQRHGDQSDRRYAAGAVNILLARRARAPSACTRGRRHRARTATSSGRRSPLRASRCRAPGGGPRHRHLRRAPRGECRTHLRHHPGGRASDHRGVPRRPRPGRRRPRVRQRLQPRRAGPATRCWRGWTA